jgi:hypothetical protein
MNRNISPEILLNTIDLLQKLCRTSPQLNACTRVVFEIHSSIKMVQGNVWKRDSIKFTIPQKMDLIDHSVLGGSSENLNCMKNTVSNNCSGSIRKIQVCEIFGHKIVQ